MKKRALSFALALVMCLALLPMSALAVDWAEVEWSDLPFIGEDTGEEFVIQKELFTGSYLSEDGLIIYNENGKMIPEIKYNALIHYNGPGGAVVIPNGVEYIHSSALAEGIYWTDKGEEKFTQYNTYYNTNRKAVTSVTIPNSVKEIDGSAFTDCRMLASVTLPDSLTAIGDSAFVRCTSLKTISIPKGITAIENNTFRECTGLTSITIPDNVTKIKSMAFSGCTNLTEVTIGAGVTSIETQAFENCPSLTTIKGVSGSYAETYAEKQGYKFVSTGGTTNPTKPVLDLTSASSWAQEGITNAVAANLVPQNLQSAYPQATTRAEFAALAVALYEQVKGAEITERKTFDDTSDINVEKAAAIGIVSGVGNNKFNPNVGLTREQAAVMLARLADAVGKPLAKQAATFNDNGSIATWAIEQVGQIQAAGIMSGVGNNTFAPQGAYTREQSIVTILRLYDVVK